jgi:hypothetical protein
METREAVEGEKVLSRATYGKKREAVGKRQRNRGPILLCIAWESPRHLASFVLRMAVGHITVTRWNIPSSKFRVKYLRIH